MSASFDYQQLTPDLIIQAIESIGVYPETGLLPLNSYENRVYQFRCDRGNRYVVKFYRPQRWSRAQIQEELDFADLLAAHEVPVATAYRQDGANLFEFGGFSFALFHSMGGRTFEVDNWDQLEVVGRFLGRIHQLAAAEPFKHRPVLSVSEFVEKPLAFLKNSELVPRSLETPYFTVLELVAERVMKAWQQVDSSEFIRLHGDLHPSNILWMEDGPGFVDLDDARQGPAVQDLWMMLSGDRQQQLAQLDMLAESYDEFCEFPAKQLPLIEPLRAMRMIHYCAWIGRRWQDPAFPRNFPWYAEDKYWEQQILALKEQLAALDEAPIRLPGQF
ncbi:serine/threonine protein kinase [Paraferrimonas sedimenticola]|uniref:Stress response kinase A n=1 Tax=Paraferrimonas sedimenticola TaxID=375674 RepID=A0AA37RYN8_9GAMM|nr:serine/threonine protein kinase [Paraferrimonas sedimenticola]GLP97583.1 stress response kinase A [Paraferrimonas sedimenticola]